MDFNAKIMKDGKVIAHNAEVVIKENLIRFVWNNGRNYFERKISKDKDLASFNNTIVVTSDINCDFIIG